MITYAQVARSVEFQSPLNCFLNQRFSFWMSLQLAKTALLRCVCNPLKTDHPNFLSILVTSTVVLLPRVPL